MRTPIVGFTEGEVTNLCVKYSSDFSMMKYFDGLSGTAAELVGGGEVKMDPRGFADDLVTVRK